MLSFIFSIPDNLDRDSETLMVDARGQLYMMSKVGGGQGRVFTLPDSAWGKSRVMLKQGPRLAAGVRSGSGGPVSADISPKGDTR